MEKKIKWKTAFSLFLSFLKIGAFTFGGGYAMIPLIQKEISEKKGWINNEDILDIVAISESTPGPIAINSATFVGFKVCGFTGALFSTIGVVIPSFVIITVIAMVLKQFESLKIVKYAFFGVRAGILALILKALTLMYKECPKNIFSYALIALSFTSAAILKVNVLLIIILCGCAGAANCIIKAGRNAK